MLWVAVIPLLASSRLDPAIDLDAKAMSTEQLLAQLSSRTGEHLRAAPSVAQSIVFVKVKGVPLKDLESRLATALQATWTKDGGYEVLKRTAADDKRIWQEHVAYRRKLVDQAIKDAQDPLKQPFDAHALATGLQSLDSGGATDTDPAAAQKHYQLENALFARAPLTRLLDRLILACKPEDLAAVGPYERHVFRIDPTRMQYGFDADRYQAAIETYAKEQQAWKDEAANFDFSDKGQGRMVSDPRSQIEHDTRLQGLTLEVSRGEMTALFMANLASDEPTGYTVMTQRAFADPGRQFLDSQMTPSPPQGADPLVQLSPASQEFDTALAQAFRSREPKPISQKLRDRMAGIEKDDPLSWTVRDVLEGYADSKSLNVVAALPDGAVSIMSFLAFSQPPRVGQSIRALQDSGTLAVTEKDGWALLTPFDRYEADLDFTPRSAVAELMKATFAAGRMDIRDYAKYAFDSKRLNRGGFGDWFLAMIDRSVLGASDRTDWKALQLFGSFSAAQQNALENGGKFTYDSLTPGQKEIVEKIVYAKRLTGPLGPRVIDFRAVEPTRVFAYGIPGSCTVSGKSTGQRTIVAYSLGSDGKTQPARDLSTTGLAEIEMNVVGDTAKMAMYGVPNLAGYAMGANLTVTLRVEVAPGVYSESTITVPDFDPDATPVTWDKLPAPYPANIRAEITRLKQNRTDPNSGKVPPP